MKYEIFTFNIDLNYLETIVKKTILIALFFYFRVIFWSRTYEA